MPEFATRTQYRRAVEDLVRERFEQLRRFATSHARQAPASIRDPHNLDDWLKMDPLDRKVTIKAHLRNEARAELGPMPAPVSPNSHPRPGTAPAPERRAAVTDLDGIDEHPRVVVACIGGCGQWLPARPGRPVRRRCEPLPTGPSPAEQERARYIASVVGLADAHPTRKRRPSPVEPGEHRRSPRRKLRAVCPRSKATTTA